MKIRLYPGKLAGEIKNLPAGKSMLQRYIISSALAQGESIISGYTPCNDAASAIACAEALGARVVHEKGALKITGMGSVYQGSEMPVFECGDSAAVLRFFIPVAAAVCGGGIFHGSEQLFRRPLEPYLKIFDECAISYKTGPSSLIIEGKLKSGVYSLPGNISSQFFSGLLFALPLTGCKSAIEPCTPPESAGYADMTIEVIKSYGINAEKKGGIYITYPGEYKAADAICPADSSAAAFWHCANFIGNEIKVPECGDVLSPDYNAPELFSQLAYEKDTVISVSMCPDMLPALALAATQKTGDTLLSNAARLRFKESDRLHSTAAVLNQLGGAVEELSDSLLIHGGRKLKGGVEVEAFEDHRIVMMAAIASTVCDEPVVINGYECAAKSYPGFFSDFDICGGITDVF